MALQKSDTPALDKAQKTIIAQTRFTAEHSAPCIHLVERMRLPRGASTITVPKVGQVEFHNLVEGVDLVDEEDIGMTTTDLTTSEVGAKVILTDKLVRQLAQDPWNIVGRQLGDGFARKQDKDIISLFSGLNGGVTLGAAGATMHLKNASGAIANAKGRAIPGPLYIVQHPYPVYDLVTSVALTPSAAAPLSGGLPEKIIANFWRHRINQVDIFEDGNVSIDANSDAVGALFSKMAIAYVESQGYTTERERDASLRATELVVTADYGVFELDDSYGFPLTYDATAPDTAAA